MNHLVAVSLNVISDNPHHIARAHEAMSRLASGLALDGIDTELYCGPRGMCDHDEEEAA